MTEGPYLWSVELEDGTKAGPGDLQAASGAPAWSPSFVPSSCRPKTFSFVPRSPGYQPTVVTLGVDEVLDYSMRRREKVGSGEPIETRAVMIGKKHARSGAVLERKFYFSDGRVVSFPGSFKELMSVLQGV